MPFYVFLSCSRVQFACVLHALVQFVYVLYSRVQSLFDDSFFHSLR